jgi:alkanesulfonate monooxygenase SsuD/methylene tetrahydromethanopterin reductase-like flavin-dependent oxidoreductase (luciferase family)
VDDLRVGLKLAPQFTTVDELRAVWRIADEAGFDHCWNFDHFASIRTDTTGDILEGWTLLGAMAKMAVTVDRLSGGRLEFGIGAAWAENEHEMLGLEFGTTGQRIARLEEACRAIKLLWTEERASFDGEYYRLTEAIANPKPVQQPHPPIWIGGSGERKTLRVVAQHADVWNLAGGDVDEGVRLSGVLDGHCAAVGRDPAEIRRSVQLFFSGDAETLLTDAERFANNGFRELIVGVMGRSAEPQATAVAEVLTRLRSL